MAAKTGRRETPSCFWEWGGLRAHKTKMLRGSVDFRGSLDSPGGSKVNFVTGKRSRILSKSDRAKVFFIPKLWVRRRSRRRRGRRRGERLLRNRRRCRELRFPRRGRSRRGFRRRRWRRRVARRVWRDGRRGGPRALR